MVLYILEYLADKYHENSLLQQINRELNYLRLSYRFEKIAFSAVEFQVASYI